jgi:hypothetical protein
VVSDFHLLLQEQIPSLMRYAAALTRDPEQAADPRRAIRARSSRFPTSTVPCESFQRRNVRSCC